MPSVVFTPPSSEQLAADSDPGPVWIVKIGRPHGSTPVTTTCVTLTSAGHVEDWSTTTVDGTHETTVEVDRLFTLSLSVSSTTSCDTLSLHDALPIWVPVPTPEGV